MSVYVSLLRGINVGAQKMIRMESLRTTYEGLGLTHVRTYVQSGNVVFECPGEDPFRLARRIEIGLEHSYGYEVPVFIRQPEQLQQILANNPFLNDRHEDPSKLHVSFLYHIPSEPWWSELLPPRDIADEFARGELAIYLFCPNGYGNTRLSNSFFERKLGMPVTTRNWNTVNTLYSMTIER